MISRDFVTARARPMLDALFGLGPEIAAFDAQTQQLLGVSAAYQPMRTSAKGSAVNTFIFGRTEPAREVSAIIYSNSAMFSQPRLYDADGTEIGSIYDYVMRMLSRQELQREMLVRAASHSDARGFERSARCRHKPRPRSRRS